MWLFNKERLDELQELVRAQDVEVLGCVTQRPASIHTQVCRWFR